MVISISHVTGQNLSRFINVLSVLECNLNFGDEVGKGKVG